MEKSGLGSGKRAYEFFDEDDDEAPKIDLVEIQRSILINLLSLKGHSVIDEDEEETEVSVGDGQSLDRKALTFKLLVLDQTASNIVATVMKVGQLRDCNVTLHLGLNNKREQVPDIPAVYLLCKVQSIHEYR